MLLTNYITSAWRNILRHKLFSIINILGLAIGLAAVMLIALYVRYETSYDSFWKNADNIYRMHYTFNIEGAVSNKSTRTPPVVKDVLLKDFPDVEYAARIYKRTAILKYNNQAFNENTFLVDQDITKVFDFKVISGNIDTALEQNTNIILTQSMAKKTFGNKNPIGETVTTNFQYFNNLSIDYKVAAIIEDIPDNSMMNIDIMALFDRNYITNPLTWDSWTTWVPQLYFTLKDGKKINEINEQMVNFINRNAVRNGRMAAGDISNTITLNSLSIKDLYLNAEGAGDMHPHGNKDSMTIFSFIAIFILLIASFNFINLSTARATRRAKEIGLRKIVGAKRRNLIFQFLGESVILTMIGLFLALTIAELSLPFYNEIINRNFEINFGIQDYLIILIFGVVIGVLGGLYPAFILSNYRPAVVLRANNSTEDKKSNQFRSFLVILQFSISISLFVAMAVVYSQLSYIKNFNMAFNEDNLLHIAVPQSELFKKNAVAFFEELRAMPNIVNVTHSSIFLPHTYQFRPSPVRNLETQLETNIYYTTFGYDVLKTFEIELLAGRDFARDRNDKRDENNNPTRIIVNQAVIHNLGFSSPEAAIGKTIQNDRMDNNTDKIVQLEYEIIGVIPNIHFASIKLKPRPEYYVLIDERHFFLTMRYNGDPQKIVSQIGTLWKDMYPDQPFEPEFVSDIMSTQYQEEQAQMTMFAAFSALAIFIACLGLFGLATFTAERRTKEIGIRKVFGAETLQIVKLLVWQFSKPVLIANIIAWPITYFAMSHWLESFVYRIDDMVIIALCLIAGLTALLIAWATVAGNSYAVARQNPINALRYE